MLKILLPIVVLAICIGVARFLTSSTPAISAAAPAASRALAVETTEVRVQSFTPMITSFGTLEPATAITLVAQVSGQVRGVSPSFRNGAFVRKDDWLIRIDTADYQIQVKIAEGQLSEAQALYLEETGKVQLARRDWEKIGGSGAASALALREPQLAATKAKVAAAEAQLEQARLNLGRAEIRAPFDGRIVAASADVGQVIASGSVVGELYATAFGEVRLPVKSSDLAYIDLPGDHGWPVKAPAGVNVDLLNRFRSPPEVWRASIVRSEGRIDSQTQQLALIAQIDSPFVGSKGRQALRSGQYLSASITGREQLDSILVPASAVYQNSYVYLLKDERLFRQAVTIGWQGEIQVQIKAGLQAGDLLVTTVLGQVGSGTLARQATAGATP